MQWHISCSGASSSSNWWHEASVRDVFSVMNGGVSLTITQLLSFLGAAQEAKIELKAKQTAGNIIYIHLNEICALLDQNAIISKIKALPADNTLWLSFSPLPMHLLTRSFLRVFLLIVGSSRMITFQWFA
jgi:hypothetical protein